MAAGAEDRSGAADESGISAEDRREILLHIDEVSRSSRIVAGPDTWKVRPRKRGGALPLVVNAAGAALLALGLILIGRLVAPEREGAGSSTAALASAEGRLLQEIKREAEGRIQEKDREIASIQERMAALDRERVGLLASVEERVRAKEAELRAALDQELERERQRLIAEGLSEAAIRERLAEFERRKTEEFKAALAAFADKAESDRKALEASLDEERDRYRDSLTALTAERQRIQDDSRRREQELRAQLDEKSRDLEAERARIAASLEGSRAELARLNEEAARAKAVEDRLVGLFASARQALRDGRIDEAAATLSTLRSYLAEPQFAAAPSLQSRRAIDLFAADLIERAIAEERAGAAARAAQAAAREAVAADTRSAEEARAAELAERVRSAVDAALAAQAAESGGAASAETERRAAAASEAAAAIGAAAGSRELEAAFSRLLEGLPLGPGEASRIYARVKAAGYGEAEAAWRASSAAALREAEKKAADRAAAVQAELSAARDELAALGRRLEAAERDAASARDQRDAALAAAAAPAAAAVPAAAGPSPAEYQALETRVAGLETALAAATARYEAIAAAYSAYASGEDAILSGGGDLALVEARAALDRFLDRPEVSAAMPGLRERLSRYLASYQAAGQREVLFNAADIVDGAARIRDAATRARYFGDLERRYAEDAQMLEFIATVRDSFR